MFRIGGNTFYDRKNKITMKILEIQKVRNQNNCGILRNSKQISQPSCLSTIFFLPTAVSFNNISFSFKFCRCASSSAVHLASCGGGVFN